MEKTILGRTGLEVTRSAFGALPIQRLSMEDAAKLLRMAYEGGINFFDTARAYSNSEEKIALGLADVRHKIIIATKTQATAAEKMREHLEQSLTKLKTDYIDIYQLHNPDEVPMADSEMYIDLLKAKEEGKIRFISITCHKLTNARLALESGLYDTIQYPLSALSSDEEIAFAQECGRHNIGVIAMKAMCGGLLNSAKLSMAYLRPLANVVPIWGFQHASEVEEVLELEKNPPALTPDMLAEIEKLRGELSGDFCRGCGYCMPCAVNIEINTWARISQLLRRAVTSTFYTPERQEQAAHLDDCIHCGVCMTRCPYNLQIPDKLKASKADYYEYGKANGFLK